jgi:hypothetical protein
VFGLDDGGAQQLMRATFTEESAGLHASYATHTTARDSYRAYLDGMAFLAGDNREMRTMSQASIADWLAQNRAAFARWRPAALALPGAGAP